MKNRFKNLLTIAVLLCGLTTSAWAQPTNLGEPLITSANQLSSPFSDPDEGQNLGALCDFDANTFWHSDWHSEVSSDYHWLQIELLNVTNGDMVLWIKRRIADIGYPSCDHPTRAILTGSLTADFTTEIPIDTIELGNAASGEEYTTDVWKIPSPVKYIRFTPIDCKNEGTGFRTFWHAAEINLYRYTSINEQPSDLGEPLITCADQLSSPFSDPDEGQNLGALCDFDANTFWHSDWHNEVSGDYHWLQMELPEPMEGGMVLWIKRRHTVNNHPSRAILTGSLTADFEIEIPIDTIELDNAANSQEYTTDVWNISSPVKFIRFTPIDCKGEYEYDGFRIYWHAAEINLYRYESNNGNDQPNEKPEPGENNDLSEYDDAIYFEKAEGQSGTFLTLSLKMKSKMEVSGFQANLYMPEGVTISKIQRGEGLKVRDENDEYIYSFGNSVKEDGSHFLLSYSASNVPMSAGTREIAKVTVKIADDVKSGDYPLIVRNIEMAYGSENVKVEEIRTMLSISDYVLGDANSDGTVSVTDITSIGGYLMDNSKPINAKAADANQDGVVSVTDITLIGQMLFANTRAAIRGFFKTRSGEETADIVLTDVKVNAGEEITLPVTMTGQASGFQFDVYTPEGVSIKKVQRGNLLKAMDDNDEYIFTIQSSSMNDGEFHRVVAYNTSNTPTAEAGEIVKLVLSTDESLADGEYEIQLKGIECGLSGVVLSTYKETSAKLTVGGGETAIDFVNSGHKPSEIFNLFGMKVTKTIPGQTYIYKYANGNTVKRVAK